MNSLSPPDESEVKDQRTTELSHWWIAISYLMPILVVAPLMNADGWYGTGPSGAIQRMMQIVAFLLGTTCAFYVLLRGNMVHRIAILPAALGYAVVVVAIIVERFF